ncbi:MAG: glycosyltransferase [Methylococcaceae bacterium]
MVDSLSISLVIYYPDEKLLQQTLQTLFAAAAKATSAGLLDGFFLTVVDNSEHSSSVELGKERTYTSLIYSAWGDGDVVVLTPGNVGYGAGHNRAIHTRCEAFHLVINPDVTLHENAIIECIKHLQQHPQVGLVTPFCQRPDGSQEFLCKAYPSVWVLLLRGFAPNFVKRYFQQSLSAYDLSDQSNDDRHDILIASGCFMFFRRQALQDVRGFCESFFLYFEDFDLSMRLTNSWQIAYVPAVRIVHYGGHSAKKGLRHIRLFVHSSMLFFKRHGWRFW